MTAPAIPIENIYYLFCYAWNRFEQAQDADVGAADIRLDAKVFARVQLHRNTAHYGFLLNVARLAFDCLLPTQDGQGYRFTDVLRDEKKMAAVFEEFVRNFYRTEQSTLKVKPLTISWDAYPVSVTGTGRLPSMRADVFLQGPTRRVIIDTKYYASALQSYHGTESFHSGNMYQLFSYLKNAAGVDPSFCQAEGILLYPASGVTLRETYLIQGHGVTIATIDLAKPWPHVHKQLIDLVV